MNFFFEHIDLLTHLFIQIAICTADSRANTVQFVEMLDVSDCVDMIVCGDDTNTEPKPSPYNALKICEALGVDPAEVQEFSLNYYTFQSRNHSSFCLNII